MIVALTLNPALDQTWAVDGLALGESHRVPAGASRAGGKGVNVARVLHATGREVLAVAPVGGATGHLFQSDLARSGVPYRVVAVRPDTRRSIAAVDAAAGSATLLNETGGELSPQDTDAVDAAVLGLPTPDAVAISGSLPPGYSPARLGALVRLLRARGARVVVDTSGPGLLEAAAAGADLLKPNREELEAATGMVGLDTGIDALLALGAGGVVASDGEAGLVVAAGGERVAARLPRPVEGGNPTGAGDAAVASLVAHLAQPGDLVDAATLARRAVAWSASAVSMPLAGELGPDADARQAEVLVTPIRTEIPCP